MSLAIPIPIFIILDRFDKEIDSIIIFERIVSLLEADKLSHATTFILNFIEVGTKFCFTLRAGVPPIHFQNEVRLNL